MFTGIVEHVGKVVSKTGSSGGAILCVDLGPCAEGVKLGDSIAVDGVCLTATKIQQHRASFDVGPESLQRTTLGGLTAGMSVNLERALAFGGRLDGHLVQGHVDCVGELTLCQPRGRAVDVTVAVEQPLDLVVEKGSIALAGVSLTVNAVDNKTFSVSLVPFTQDKTVAPRVGQRVNVEFDIIGRYVARLLGQSRSSSLSKDFLKEHGFA